MNKLIHLSVPNVEIVQTEMAEIKLQNIAIQKSNLEIEKTITFINKQYDDMLKQIETLQKEKQTYRESIKCLETKLQDIQRSKKRVFICQKKGIYID